MEESRIAKHSHVFLPDADFRDPGRRAPAAAGRARAERRAGDAPEGVLAAVRCAGAGGGEHRPAGRGLRSPRGLPGGREGHARAHRKRGALPDGGAVRDRGGAGDHEYLGDPDLRRRIRPL